MKYSWIVFLLGLTTHSYSHDLSFDECLEGSQFILHAAMSRDDGVGRDEFVGKVQDDLRAIQAFPAEYRWFAQDEEDERFLLTASEDVFDRPRPPERHQSDFLQACVGRMRADAGGQETRLTD